MHFTSILLKLSSFAGYPSIDKVWGTEIVLVNCERYCAKLLVLKEGFQCSLHSHVQKCETFCTLAGKVYLEYGSELAQLQSVVHEQGDSMQMLPGTWHRFHAMSAGGAVILEISTFHSDDDVLRLAPSGPCDQPF